MEVVEHGPPGIICAGRGTDYCDATEEFGHLEVLIWLRSIGSECDSSIMVSAI